MWELDPRFHTPGWAERRLKELREEKAPIPENTLRNQDGTPYSAGTGLKALEDTVFQALGEASMCWSERPKGVFDSANAKRIGDELMQAIKEYASQEAVNKGAISINEARTMRLPLEK